MDTTSSGNLKTSATAALRPNKAQVLELSLKDFISGSDQAKAKFIS